MRHLLASFLLLLSFATSAQMDTVRRKWVVAGGHAIGLTSSIIVLNEAWYKDYPRSSFHLFDDATNWRGMDKIGHAFTGYRFSSASYRSWLWMGMPRRKAALVAAGITWGYQFSIEVLDGFSSEWGFSIADLIGNTAGSGLFLAQQLAWDEQRMRLKFSYKPSPYAALRPNTLGSTLPEKMLKDYNAQSYWLSITPGMFFEKDDSFPKWLQLSFGYSTDAMLKGDNRLYTVNGFTYRAQSEFALSLDIDWGQVPVRRKWVRQLLRPLNTIKFPFPAVYWRGTTCYVGWM